MGFPGFAQGFAQDQDVQARKAAQTDEQRHAQISLALQQATTPQEKQAVLQDAYAKDPSAVKGWAQKMIGKVTGQTPQPAPSPYATPTTTSAAPGMTLDDGTALPAGPQTTVSGPAPKTRAEAFAGHAARGQTTEQQAQASDQAQGQQKLQLQQQALQQKQQQDFKLIDQYITDPAANKKAKEDYAQKNTGVAPKDSVDARARADFAAFQQANPNYDKTFEQWKTEQSGLGRAAVPKPKKGYAYDVNTGQVRNLDTGERYSRSDKNLPPDVAKAFASQKVTQADKNATALRLAYSRGAAYNASKPIDVVGDDGDVHVETAGQAEKTGASRPGSNSYKAALPTGQMRNRAGLASSANEQMDDLKGILVKRGTDIFGPGAGRETRIKQWLGSQDPDAARAQAALTTTADHLIGVFGGRSAPAAQKIENAVGLFKTNPEASIAALEQFQKAANNIEAQGRPRGPAPKASGGHTVGEKKKFPNGKTGVWDGQGWVAQ